MAKEDKNAEPLAAPAVERSNKLLVTQVDIHHKPYGAGPGTEITVIPKGYAIEEGDMSEEDIKRHLRNGHLKYADAPAPLVEMPPPLQQKTIDKEGVQ